MKSFIISTDTCCDLPDDFCLENHLDIHPLYYRFGDDEVYGGDNQLPLKDFYERMRGGEMPTTMATNPEISKEIFRKHVESGVDILHIAFSSGLSSSYQNTALSAKELMEEFPGSNIIVIDSLSAALGQGLLVYQAIQFQKQGHTIEEVRDYVEEIKLHIAHTFTVDDLFHLYRGGRVSKATAIVGTIAGIKPLLHVDNEGHLINTGKIRGRKKSLTSLVTKMQENMGSYADKCDVVGISHGDCLEDAQFVASLVEEKIGKKTFLINTLCPTIGSHTGPDLIALFYMAEQR